MEDHSLVVQLLLRRLAQTLFAGAQGPEVIARLGRHRWVQFENDSTSRQSAQRHVEEAAHLRGWRS